MFTLDAVDTFFLLVYMPVFSIMIVILIIVFFYLIYFLGKKILN